MFIVFNKEKIKAYFISVGVVAILFSMPLIIKEKQAYEASASVKQTQENEIDKTNEIP